MRIRWRDLPAEPLATEIREAVGCCKCVLPRWLEVLTVYYDDTDIDNYASTSVHFEQREAHVSFHPLFWSLDGVGRRLTVLHEFAHVTMGPVDDVFAGLLLALKGRACQAWAEEVYRHANESVVSDLAQAYLRIQVTP